MQRKVFRAGNSMVVSLPKQVLDVLRLEEGSEVTLELDHEQRRLVVKAAGPEVPGIDAGFAAQVANFIQRYRPALEALAE